MEGRGPLDSLDFTRHLMIDNAKDARFSALWEVMFRVGGGRSGGWR